MAKITESLINVVTMNRLKLLISLHQKVSEHGYPLVNSRGYTDKIAPGEKVEPNLSVLIVWNVVSLYISVQTES